MYQSFHPKLQCNICLHLRSSRQSITDGTKFDSAKSTAIGKEDNAICQNRTLGQTTSSLIVLLTIASLCRHLWPLIGTILFLVGAGLQLYRFCIWC